MLCPTSSSYYTPFSTVTPPQQPYNATKHHPFSPKPTSSKLTCERKAFCPICNRKLVKKENLKKHMENCHSNLIVTSSGMKVEPIVVDGEMVCPVCRKVFGHGRNFKSNLDRHMLIHEGVRPYVCSTCGRRFRQQTHLKSHQASHLGTRPHRCGSCGKSFSRADNLRRHMLIHDGLKPFACLSCGKSYTQSHHLKSHIEKCKC